MKIDITDLGILKKAQIDLTKGLTLFCGLNGTGKTYLSFVIYSLLNRKRIFPRILPKESIDPLLETGELSLQLNLDELCAFRTELTKDVCDNTHELFGISGSQAMKFFKDFHLRFASSDEEFKKKIVSESFDIEFNGLSCKVTCTKKAGETTVMLILHQKNSIKPENIDIIRLFLLPNLYASIVMYPVTNAVIFPVERNSIYTFSKELSIKRNILIDQMQDLESKKFDPMDLISRKTTRYPQPIRDGLEVAEDMSNLQKHDSEFRGFAEELEEQLLHGRLSVSNEGEVQFAPNTAKSKKLPIHLTASIVKTLSSLVFYLKHIAQKNDLIIIDEPEINLHPDNQIIVARVFAQLMNKGFRLLVSTHSDYIVRELNNLIMLGQTNPESGIAERLGYRPDERISPDDVNAYYFTYKTKTSVEARHLPMTKFGIEIPSIDTTIDSLNNRSEELYYAVKYHNDNGTCK